MEPTLQKLSEMATKPVYFTVDYYAITPKGSRARFQRRGSTQHITGMPQSETGILYYLRELHPRCDIQINKLKFN